MEEFIIEVCVKGETEKAADTFLLMTSQYNTPQVMRLIHESMVTIQSNLNKKEPRTY